MPDLFPTLRVQDVTVQHKIEELEREIKVRRRVYPRWVEKGTLKPDIADLRIKIMVAILRDYQKQLDPGGTNGHQEKAGETGQTP